MKIVGTKAELTDREKAFIRTWKRYFRAPGDWATDKMADGTSSFLDWAEFLAPEHVSLSIIEGILAAYAEQDETPVLHAVQRIYRDKTAGAAARPQDGRRCGVCEDTGCFSILQAWPHGLHKPPVFVSVNTARKLPRDCAITEARAPCKCHIGQRVAQRRGVSPSHVDRLWAFRLSGLTERMRLEELVATEGLDPGQDAEAPSPDTGIAEADWPAPQPAVPDI